ncbi:hypothetical protein SDC9_135893 [bioreactor metagenome]|uniref:Uncharacterized protein n=1 Tax=bioreactor metagenome TaxID=1076179 RepID=A0A645DHL8_9ZZZZ
MKKIFNKENIKKTWEENKKFFIATGVVVGGVITAAAIQVINKDNKEEIQDNDTVKDNEFDYGRDCIMTFTVEETGETLGMVKCTESYVKDWVDSGLLETVIENDYPNNTKDSE